uniref:Uncharacterized protein n=1 Tax=Anguilla anguilla TaxID=7936 RepID=A0A0E9RZI5_ANGAN
MCREFTHSKPRSRKTTALHLGPMTEQTGCRFHLHSLLSCDVRDHMCCHVMP